jgi:hypothetical protein
MYTLLQQNHTAMLLKQCVHILLMRNMEVYSFKTLDFYDGSEREWRLKYLLDLQTFVVDKTP